MRMADAQHMREVKAAPAACPAGARPCVRPVEPDDGPAIHDMLRAGIPDVLTDRDRWLARWRWQYWDNPHRQGRAPGHVLAEGKRILGHLGAVYLPLRVGQQHQRAVVGADYAVSQEGMARAGLFAALELAQRLFADNEDCLVLATTANDKTGAVFGRFGCRPVEWTREFWRASTSVPQQFRTCCGGRSRLMRRAFNSRLGPWVMRALVAGFQAAGRTAPIPIRGGCSLETTVPQLAGELGQLGESMWAADHEAGPSQGQHARRTAPGASATDRSRPRTPGPRVVGVHRSQAYLDWRYAHHPERDHIRVLVVRDAAGRPLGAAVVFREERPDRHVAYLEDLLVLPGERDAARTLLCAALCLACQGGADYLVTSPGRREWRDLYWELGFESRARNAPAVVMGRRTASSAADPTAQSTAQSTTAQSTSADSPDSSPDEHLEFWHGMMF